MSDPIQSGHHRLARTFNFRVRLQRSSGTGGSGPPRPDAPPASLGDGGFQEVTGLEIEMEAQELKEGGRNDGMVRLIGRGKYTNLVLKRGMFFPPSGGVAPEMWRWIQTVLGGTRPPTRYDGTIDVLDTRGEAAGRTLATWSFTRGLPVRVKGPELNAKTGEIAIEELHIAHEGLRLEG
jgi:phage tail-like protein